MKKIILIILIFSIGSALFAQGKVYVSFEEKQKGMAATMLEIDGKKEVLFYEAVSCCVEILDYKILSKDHVLVVSTISFFHIFRNLKRNSDGDWRLEQSVCLGDYTNKYEPIERIIDQNHVESNFGKERIILDTNELEKQQKISLH